jgi:hypothetical protein
MFPPVCAVLAPGVAVIVHGAKFCPLLGQTLAKLSIYTRVDDTIAEDKRHIKASCMVY